jgi:membrane fusion protein (multidrug efflux system)
MSSPLAYGSPSDGRRRLRLLVGATVVLALVSACGKKSGDGDEPSELSNEGPTAIPVVVSELELASFTDTTKVFGSLAPLHTVTITAETTGRIEYLPVDDGSRVKKGQTLARINARVTSAQLKQAQASHDMQKVETERTRKLVEKKLAPPQQLDVAEAQLKQAEASVELIEANLAKAIIRSPIDGIVVMTNADEGEVASMGLPLMTIVDISSVVVGADVPERDVALMKTGQPVPVKVEAFPDKTFTGLIGYIDYVANTSTRTFLMKIGIDNKEELLRPGMLASVDLERRTFEDVVVVPRDAVIDDIDGKFAYVVDGDVARRRAVTLGPTRGRFAVVTDGLQVGDKLLIAGHRQVVDAQKIAVNDAGPCCKQQMLAPTLSAADLGIPEEVLRKAMTGGPDAVKAALEAATKSKKTQNSAAEPAAGGR